jgi:hypothetical protein
MVIGSLCYFNLANVTFHDGPNLYAISTTISIILSIIASTNYVVLSLLDWTAGRFARFMRGFIGNVHSVSDSTIQASINTQVIFFQLVSLLGPPGPHYLAPVLDSDSMSMLADFNDLPTFKIDQCVQVFIQTLR